MKYKISLRSLLKLYFLSTLLVTFISIQRANAQSARVDEVVSVVAFLKTAKDGTIPDEQNKAGTGFFVLDTKTNNLLLITAGHVSGTLTPNSLAVIRVKDDRPQELSLMQLTGINSPLSWRVHPTADVAVLKLDPAKEIIPLLNGHALFREYLVQELEAPSRDIPLTILGFPSGIGVQGRFSPISRETKAASGLLNHPKISAASIFLLQDPIAGGFSGSPVFEFPGARPSARAAIEIGGRFACVGLASATISDVTGGKLGVVVPAQYILEAIDTGVAVSSLQEKQNPKGVVKSKTNIKRRP